MRDLLQKVTDADGNLTIIDYDGFGRKESMTDPDMGFWQYEYDVFGNLHIQRDARNCVTTIEYDNLHRPVAKTYTGPGACDSTPDVAYTYDSTTGGNEGIGRRTGMSDTSGSLTSWFYNVLGQVTNETHTIESTNYSVTTDFDAFGRPLHQTIPSQGSTETLNYTYNEMGALSGLNNGTTAYVSQIHYNPSGQVTEQTLGNGLRQQFCYEANTLRLRNLRVYSGDVETCVETPTNPLLSFAYFYEDNGNVRQIIDATRAETLNYTYDALDRLDTVSGAYSQDYDYNEIGNITNKTTTTSTSYSYGDPAHKHAVTSLSTGGSYTYDQNGNMITRVEGGLTYMQAFDAENRLISVTVNSQTTQFVYDGDGNLVKKIKPDGSKTLYVGEIYEVDMTGGTVTGTRTYYPAAGAMRVGTTLYYVLKDHLGSASAVTNTNGTVVTGADIRYYPFGEARSSTSSMLTDKLYTGQREMAELGIYHYKARFYSPYINRFLQPDTIVPSHANPQSLNRYSYVLNNPLRYTDPTGHRQCEDYQGGCLSEKQMTKIYKAEHQKQKEKSRNKNKQNDNPSDFLSNLAYGADVAGVVLADIEMITVDTIGVLVIVDGCATGVACLPAIGTAGFIDFAVSYYSPLGGAENGAGLIALAATALADYQTGTSYLKSDRNRITLGVGQDTTVSLVNFVNGMVPEANYDAWISNKQLEYDNRRRSGELPAKTMFEINIPRITVPPPFH